MGPDFRRMQDLAGDRWHRFHATKGACAGGRPGRLSSRIRDATRGAPMGADRALERHSTAGEDAMAIERNYPWEPRISTSPAGVRRRIAWISILVVDVGFVAWGGMAALFLDHLLGPGGKTILPAAYEGLSGERWSELVRAAPMAARYMDVLYRTYGWYNVAFGVTTTLITVTAFRRGERWAWWALLLGNTITLVSAIIYDKRVNAIGPFELTEYLGLALVWAACAVTAPFAAGRARSGASRATPGSLGAR